MKITSISVTPTPHVLQANTAALSLSLSITQSVSSLQGKAVAFRVKRRVWAQMSKIQEANLESQVGERIHDVGTHRDKQEDCKAAQGEAHGQEAENPLPHY